MTTSMTTTDGTAAADHPSVPRRAWRVAGGRLLATAEPFGIMGIVNLTPDSFFDGGARANADESAAHALRLRDEGAAILDLGAESTRPGALPLPPEEEMARLAPVLLRLRRDAAGTEISADTRNASTAAAALEMGASIINDVSACAHDPGMIDVLVQHRPGFVLMHARGTPETMQRDPRYDDVRRDVMEFFERGLSRLVRAGLPEDRVILDPGIGFGKTMEHNLALLAHPEDWLSFGRPVLMALSMKSVFGGLLGLPTAERGPSTWTASALLWERGVAWHRVHHVARTRDALRLAAALAERRHPEPSRA